MTVHHPTRADVRRVAWALGWCVAAVALVVTWFQDRRISSLKVQLAKARQEAARVALLEEDLGRLRATQEKIVALLQLPAPRASSTNSKPPTLQELPSENLIPTVPSLTPGSLAPDDPVPHLWPVAGWVTQEFNLSGGRLHHGIDIAEKLGTPVVAPARGRVLQVYWDDTMGRVLEIVHPEGHLTRYAHLQSVEVKPGDQVEAGQVIARLGTSGQTTAPHLHYEVELNGTLLDPAQFLPRSPAVGP